MSAGIVRHMTGNGEMRAVAVDRVAGKVEIALAIPRVLLCAMGPQVRNFASIEDVLLSFGHDTAPFFSGIDCVQTHPERGVFEFRGNGLKKSWRTYGLLGQDYGQWEEIPKRGEDQR